MRFKDAQKILTDAGWELARVNGSHYVYKNDKETFVLPYPSGGSKDLHHRLEKQLRKVACGAQLRNGKRVG